MNKDIIWIDVSIKELARVKSKLGMLFSTYICKQLLKKHKFGIRKMGKNLTLKNVENRNEQF